MVTINGVDLSTLGLIASRRVIPRLHGASSRVVPIPGIPGGIRAGGQVPEGRLEIRGHLVRSSHAALLTAFDTLAATLRGECVIRFSDIADREWVGYLSADTRIDASRLDWVDRFAPFTLAFTLPDPTARAQAETSVVGTSPSLVLGTAASRLHVSVQNGSGSAITIVEVRVLDAASNTLSGLSWFAGGDFPAGVPSGGELIISADPFAVTVNGANAVNGTSPDGTYPIADPAAGADSLLVSVTGGAAPVVTTTYRKRW